MLYDQFGRPFAPPRKPSSDRLPQPGRADRYGWESVSAVTPALAAGALRAAEDGNLTAQSRLFDRISQMDSRLLGMMQSRANAIRGLEWQVKPAGESAADKQVAEFCRSTLRACRYFHTGLARLNRAVGHGFAALELFWDVRDSRHVISQVQEIKQRRLIQDPDTGEVKLLAGTSGWRGEPLPPFRVVLHRYDALSGNLGDTGLFRTLVWLWMFKHYSLKDFAVFCEVYGMPLRLGKYEPGAGEDEKEMLAAALRSLGTDAAGIISRNTEIEFVEVVQRTGKIPYVEMISIINTEMAIAVLGQVLTTDPGSRGTQALGVVHDQVRLDLVEGDALGLQDTIREEILRPLVGFNFGWDVPLPEFILPVPRPRDSAREAATIAAAVQAGVKVSQREARERLGFSEPDENEDLVTPFAAQTQASARSSRRAERRLSARNPLEDDGLDRAVRPLVERGAEAMNDFTDSVRAMIESDDWRMTFDDLLPLAQEVRDCLVKADRAGLLSAQAETAALRRHASGERFTPSRPAAWFRAKSFYSASAANKDALDSMRESLRRAIEEGRTRRDFAADVHAEFDRLGLSRLSPWRLETIFQTNYLEAYSASRWFAFNTPGLAEDFPYYQYLTAGDSAVRPQHRAMDGRIYRRDHPVWLTWWPPNGFKCRCRVSPISRYEIEERGLYPSDDDWPIDIPTGRRLMPDQGFTAHPADGRGFDEWAAKALPDGAAPLMILTPWASYDPVPAPDLLPGRVPADFKPAFDEMFKIQNGIGGVENFAGEWVLAPEDLFTHLADDPARLKYMGMIPEALREPHEVWSTIHGGQTTENYLVKFGRPADKTGFVAVKVLDGQLEAVTFFPIDREAEVNKRRVGAPVWIKK